MARSDNGAGNGSGKGRPRLEFDLRQVFKYGKLRCTNPELADLLGCSTRTVEERMANDEDFSRAYSRGESVRKYSLRRLLWRMAMKENTKVALRLAECELGYVPRKTIEIERTLPENPDTMTRAEAERFLEEELGTTLEERMRPPSVH